MKCDRRTRCSRTGWAQRFERKRECEQRLDERACVVVRGTTNGEKNGRTAFISCFFHRGAEVAGRHDGQPNVAAHVVRTRTNTFPDGTEANAAG